MLSARPSVTSMIATMLPIVDSTSSTIAMKFCNKHTLYCDVCSWLYNTTKHRDTDRHSIRDDSMNAEQQVQQSAVLSPPSVQSVSVQSVQCPVCPLCPVCQCPVCPLCPLCQMCLISPVCPVSWICTVVQMAVARFCVTNISLLACLSNGTRHG